MGIDDGVREAHLSHYCPGGLGVPVTTSGPVGLPDRARGNTEAVDGGFRADGDCGRCGLPLVPGQSMRRAADGSAVHETCLISSRTASAQPQESVTPAPPCP
jgi:hypothetical protein